MRGVNDDHSRRTASNNFGNGSPQMRDELENNVFERWKKCFLYCCLYPKDYEIRKDEIIMKFIAEGLCEDTDHGHSILNKLVDMFLLEAGEFYDGRGYVKMHDFMREKALKISKFMVKSKLTEIPEEKHWITGLERVSFMRSKINEIPDGFSPRCPSLSTLILQSQCSLSQDSLLQRIPESFFQDSLLQRIPESFLSYMTHLRVLDLSYNNKLECLPNSISNLENLCGLFLFGCKRIRCLPGMKKLTSLKVLNIAGCNGIRELPEDMECLASLQYLYARHRTKYLEIPQGVIAKLRNLRCLHLEYCPSLQSKEVNCLTNLQEYTNDLADLQSFNYPTFVKKLEQLKCYDISVGRCIIEQESEGRSVCFGEINFEGKRGQEVKVLLPANICCLEIQNCGGLDGCISDHFQSLSNNLSKLRVWNWEWIRDSQRKSSKAEWIWDSQQIVENAASNTGATPFKCPEKLYLETLPRLESLFKGENVITLPNCTFSSLKHLRIIGCPRMKKLLSQALLQNLQNLEILEVRGCKNLEAIIGVEDEEGSSNTRPSSSSNISCLPKLKDLELESLPKLKSIYNGTKMVCPSIEKISILDCENIERMPSILPIDEDSQQPYLPLSLEEIDIVEKEWWDSLEWHNPNEKGILESRIEWPEAAESIPQSDDDCEIDAEPIDETDVEDSNESFLSNDDEEVREVKRTSKQQIEEDIDGAENTDNDEHRQQVGGDSEFEDRPQTRGDSGCEDRAALCEDYDSNDPPSYETGSEDNLNDVGDHSSKVKFPSYNPKVYPPVLEAGLLFEDGNQFKQAIISYAVYTKRNLRFTKNEPNRIRVKCVENCPFYCCGRLDRRYRCFQLRRIKNDHKCNIEVKLGIVSQKWLEDKYEDKVIANPTIGIVELKKHIESDLKITLTVSMVRRAIMTIVKKVNAGFDDQFKRLKDYVEECLNSNPESTIIIETNRVVDNAPCTFQRIYVCFGALKRGFAQGCRKVLGLDGCFLKGKLKGEILSAVGRDANNQMYPVAWAVVEIENTDSWRWFLTLLKKDLDMSNNSEWTFLSDQQKGLTNVIQQLFSEAEHRNCARHIHANWSKKHRGMVFKKLFWKCAKATTKSQFDEVVKELEKRDLKASEDLLKYPPKLWCKAFFRTNVKCDAVDNNMSEAFKGTIVKARSKPIVPMLEDIRVATMRRIAEKHRSLDKWQGNHGHLILKKLNENVQDSVGWHVDFNGVDGFEVKKGKHHFKVKLLERTCSCRAWDLSGIPCIHAVCAIFDRKKDPADYVHHCYSKEMYQITYSHALEPINGELFWPRTECEEIGAPIPRRMIGCPKKKRNREETEPHHSKTKLSRKGRPISCSMCKESGHNKRFCPRKTTEATSVSFNSSQAGE